METLSPLLPREKMLRDGATRLTDEELLALFLRTGTRSKNVFALARDLLQHFGSLHGFPYLPERGVSGISAGQIVMLLFLGAQAHC